MNCIINIPFGDVPREFIDQLNSCKFSYEDYMDLSVLYDTFPTYWNMAVYEDEEMISFCWGTFDHLDKFIHVIRLSVLPEWRHREEHCHVWLIRYLKELALSYEAINMFFITDHFNIFLNNAPNKVYLSKARVVEVSLYENLH